MGKTEDNLMAAFAGESQANRKYLAFAKKADKDGFPQVARVFRSAAAAETVHAHAHFRVYGGVKSTVENVKAAIEGEHYEFTKMYPEYLEVARRERNKHAEWSFNVANKVEEVHAGLFQKVLNALKNNEDIPNIDYYVCKVCGNTVENTAPDKCSICGAPRGQFFKVD